MSDENGKRLESTLFPRGTDLEQGDTQAHLLDQYKVLVQTSEALVARRQTVNAFFLSMNSLLLAAIGLLAREGPAVNLVGLGVVALGIAGITLCVAWRRLVHSYSQLNTAKFEIIHLLEKRLPASIFKAEWEALGEGRDKQKYVPSTKTELVVPLVFGLLYVGSVSLAGLALAGVMPA